MGLSMCGWRTWQISHMWLMLTMERLATGGFFLQCLDVAWRCNALLCLHSLLTHSRTMHAILMCSVASSCAHACVWPRTCHKTCC